MTRISDITAKKQHIMDAAFELFLWKGFKSVTTREIAARAGVAKGALYHYFKNKDDLYQQTIREHILQTIIIKAALDDKSISPQERYTRLKNLCDAEDELRNRRFRMMFDFMIYCSDKNLIPEIISPVYRTIKSVIAQIITGAFPATGAYPSTVEAATTIIVSYLDGIHFQRFIDPDLVKRTDTNKAFWDMVETNFFNPGI